MIIQKMMLNKQSKQEARVETALRYFLIACKNNQVSVIDLVANFSTDSLNFKIEFNNGKSKSTVSNGAAQETC